MDNKKEHCSNLRKLLQEQAKKSNPCLELTAVESKSLNKLEAIADKLKRGEIVQNRQLKNVLGTEHYARYLDDYCEQTQLRDMLGDKPKEITEYEQRLKAATFAYSKADYKSQQGHRFAKKIFGASDTQFERLSEYLSENIMGHRSSCSYRF